MASRREYEMLFSLNAQLGKSFTGTFGKAQKQLLSMQNDIRDLSKIQSDVSAYTKQQQAVEATNKKLELLKQQYDNIQHEIEETGTYSADLENKLLSKQHQIDKTSASLEQQTQKLNQMGASLREAGVDTNNLGQETERLGAKIAELKEKQKEAGEGAADFGSTAANAFNSVGAAITAAGIAVALKEIYDGYMECVRVAGDFEASMSNVEALSGANQEELAQLSEMAKELGATTKFTAKESADAMGYMAMAGWSAEQMLAGMPGVLSLAAAAGEDLASVSDIVTDSMTAFGLTAADTSRYADVLAATAANANTSVGIMGETFKYAAPVAGALGYSIEDVSVAIGLMANAGVKGTNAGTALRNTFNGLLSGVKLTGKAFGECEIDAVKADGTMKDFGGTIEELRGYFNEMTEAERVNNAQAIAGQRGYAGLLAILNATEADYTKLTASIDNSSGAAKRMADIKMDNMVGQLTLLNSAWDAVKATVGEQFTPTMQNLYGEGAEVLTQVNEFLQKNPALIKAGMSFITVLGLAVGGITAYTVAAKAAAGISAMVTAAIPGVNVIMGITAGVAALTAVVVGATNAMNEGVPSVKELTEASREMQDAMQSASDAYNETVSSTMAASNVADAYITKLEDLERAGLSTAEEQKQYHNTLALLCQVVPDLAQYIDLETDSIEGGTSALRSNTEAWKENALAKAYQEELTALYSSYADVMVEAEKNSIGLTKAQYTLEASHKRQAEIVARMNDLMAEAGAKAEVATKETGMLASATDYLSGEYFDLQTELAAVNNDIRVAERSAKNYQKAIDKDADSIKEAEDAIALTEEAVRSLTGAVDDAADSADEVARQERAVNDVLNATIEKVKALEEEYAAAYEAAYSSISGQYDLWDNADKVVATSADSINKALSSQVSYWEDYNANLESLRSRTGDIEGLSEVIASFADGSKDSVNAIAGMANASDKDLAAMVQGWRDLQKVQSETSGTIADFKSDFTDQMNELTTQLRDDVSALDMSEDAAERGRATIQAFIDSAKDMEPDVLAAYEKLGAAAVSAMRPVSGATGKRARGERGNTYAVGTNYAAAGLALVGENGPELVMMQGGEKVLTAAETRELQREYAEVMMILPQLLELNSYAGGTDHAAPGLARVGENGPEAIMYAMPHNDAVEASHAAPATTPATYTVTFAPVYQITGATDAAELEAVLREHDEQLKAEFGEMLNDIEAERARSAYR